MFGMMSILIINYLEAADGKYETFNEANSPQFLLQVFEASSWHVTQFCGWHVWFALHQLIVRALPWNSKFPGYPSWITLTSSPSFNMLTTRLSQPCSPWPRPSLPSQCHLLSSQTFSS